MLFAHLITPPKGTERNTEKVCNFWQKKQKHERREEWKKKFKKKKKES
jgi:hypothetical protein